MKFCFFGNIAGALKDQTPGGAELQIALLAKALALKGHEVVIVDPHAKESFTTEEGIRLLHMPGWNKGLKGLRFFTYRIPALKKILVEQKADYYYARMRTYYHLLSYRAARKNGAKFIQSIASEIDLMTFWGKFKHRYKADFNFFRFLTLELPNDFVFDYLLKRSDYVLLQHSGQKLKFNHVRGQVRVFHNIFRFNSLPEVKHPTRDYCIQVGSINGVKGSKSLYELAQRVDKSSTLMVVGLPNDKGSKKLYEGMKNLEDVHLKGKMRHSDTLELIANARAMINTSNFEGFPNIFLEAWASGVPVISLKVNPGNVINTYSLGVCCDGDLDKMLAAMQQKAVQDVDSQRLVSYVCEFHDFNKAGDRFLNIINNS